MNSSTIHVPTEEYSRRLHGTMPGVTVSLGCGVDKVQSNIKVRLEIVNIIRS